jgi:7-carboxy-7-deazaguanine synthase
MQGALGTVIAHNEKTRGYVHELFTSIQGEGIKVGCRQDFIRFLGCNLSCNYCDTPETQTREGPFILHGEQFDNPVALSLLVSNITESEVAITGGEPLLQHRFLLSLCAELKKREHRIYLDTNGTLPDELAQVIEFIDIVSLDFKVPTATGRPKLWDMHEQCLRVASSKQVFVKMVINENVLPQEIDTACDIIERIDRRIPLVLQPVFGRHIPQILDIQKKAAARITQVRVIPQVHKYLGIV